MKRIRVVPAVLPLVLAALLGPALADDAANGQPSDQQDPDKKQVTVEKTVTGPNGRTWTRESQTTREGNTTTRTATRTAPNGASTTTTTTRQGSPRKPKPRSRPQAH